LTVYAPFAIFAGVDFLCADHLEYARSIFIRARHAWETGLAPVMAKPAGPFSAAIEQSRPAGKLLRFRPMGEAS